MNEPDLVPLAWLAGCVIELDEDQLRGALRRALLLLAAGGDPTREPELDGRAAASLAAELDTPERREQLALELRQVGNEVASLLGDPDLAWRAFACALLARELAGE